MRASDFVASETERQEFAAALVQTEKKNAVNTGLVGKADKSGEALGGRSCKKASGASPRAIQRGKDGKAAVRSTAARNSAASALLAGHGSTAEKADSLSAGTVAETGSSAGTQLRRAMYAGRGTGKNASRPTPGKTGAAMLQGAAVDSALKDSELEGADSLYYKAKGIGRLAKKGRLAAGRTARKGQSAVLSSAGKRAQEAKGAQEVQRRMQSMKNQAQAMQRAASSRAAASGAGTAAASHAAAASGGGILAAGLSSVLLPILAALFAFLLLIVIIAGSSSTSGGSPLPAEVEQWRGAVTEACTDCGVDAKWTNLILAMMAQESGGNPGVSSVLGAREDVMQAAEGAYGSVIWNGSAQLAAYGVTPTSPFEAQTARASIYAGVLEFKDNLALWEGWLGPIEVTDIPKLKLLVQGYNYGANGWFSWCRSLNIREWTLEKSQLYSDTRMPAGAKGTPNHAELVMRYYAAGVISGGDYVSAAIAIAADDTHGYSQPRRTFSPDVDCSSLVYYSLLHSGYTADQLGGTYPFTTRTMGGILTQCGFTQYPFTGIDGLMPGDILLRTGHTEIYIGQGQNVGAHSDYDGRPGDSSGSEVDIGDTGTGWSVFFRRTS